MPCQEERVPGSGDEAGRNEDTGHILSREPQPADSGGDHEPDGDRCHVQTDHGAMALFHRATSLRCRLLGVVGSVSL